MVKCCAGAEQSALGLAGAWTPGDLSVASDGGRYRSAVHDERTETGGDDPTERSPGGAPERVAGYRTDPLTGDLAYIVPARQGRPNLPSAGCPFCVGGLEAPQPYDVLAFPNRWPTLPDGRCEVVLYSPDHQATFASIGPAGVRKVVDLWAERTAELGSREDVAYVLVFENRGAEVGATIHHPHGQIYAFDVVPPRPRAELERNDPAALDRRAAGPSDERLVASVGGWRAWVPWASTWPYEMVIAPDPEADWAQGSVPADLPSLCPEGRDGLSAVFVDCLTRLDSIFDAPMPYMLWIHQRPFDGGDWPDLPLHVHVAAHHRAPGVARFIAAGEHGGHVMLNTVDPSDAAAALRAAR